MQNAMLDETQAGFKIAGRNINDLRYACDNTLMAERKEELGLPCLQWGFWIWSQVWQGPLEEGMAVHTAFLA